VWECGEGQADTQTAVANMHFASALPHAKCNEKHGERDCGRGLNEVPIQKKVIQASEWGLGIKRLDERVNA